MIAPLFRSLGGELLRRRSWRSAERRHGLSRTGAARVTIAGCGGYQRGVRSGLVPAA
jgi:hypothetical protein